VNSISSPNAICSLWGDATAFGGFEETNNPADMRYYDIDCFANAGCDLNTTVLCPGYVQGGVGNAPMQTGAYDNYYY